MHSQQNVQRVYSKDGRQQSHFNPFLNPRTPWKREDDDSEKGRSRTRRPIHRQENVVFVRSGLFSTYFPAAHSEKEAHHIGLLLLLKLFDILEGTHDDCQGGKERLAQRQSSRISSIDFDRQLGSNDAGLEDVTNRLEARNFPALG